MTLRSTALLARVLTGNAQPRTRAECDAFLMAAFEPGDVFDFSNPADVEEYETLYPPVKRSQEKRPARRTSLSRCTHATRRFYLRTPHLFLETS
jgi:hypothetical protein